MAMFKKKLSSIFTYWPVAILAFGAVLSMVWIGAMIWFALALVKIV